MKKILLIAGLVLQLAAIVTAGVLSSGHESSDWTCHENTSNEDAIMDCYGANVPETGLPAIPVTISLLGMGLLVTSIAVGQNAQPSGAPAQPQQHQAPMPPPAQPQAQQHPQAPQQPNVPHSGQQISYQYGQPGQPPQYRPGQSPES